MPDELKREEFQNQWLVKPWSDPDSTDNECEWCYCRKPDVRPRLGHIDLKDNTERMLCDWCDSFQYPDISNTGEKNQW